MNTKTNIEEDIKQLKIIKENIDKKYIKTRNSKAIENILADRERQEKEKEIHIKLEQQHKKEYLDIKDKYDSLIKKIKSEIEKLKKDKKIFEYDLRSRTKENYDKNIYEIYNNIEQRIKALQELLDKKEEI